MDKNIWIYAEHRNGKVAESFYELLTKAYAVAGDLEPDTRVAAIVLGEDIEPVIEELKVSGVQLIYVVKHQKLSQYNPEYYPMVLADIAKKYQPLMIWLPASCEGAEIAPSAASKLKTGLAAHCVDILVNAKGEMAHMVPAFGGKVLNEILIPKCRPMMASVKPGIFSKEEIQADDNVEIIREMAEVLDSCESRIKMVGEKEIEMTGLPVEKAEIVVAGGLGIGTTETWEKARKLAAALNAAVGYTRPLIDIGLEETEENMIGASGKSTKPKLYLAFGISGASHHISGMKDSSMIISVNTDEEADIFNVSDYKAVCDCGAVLEELLKQF